jgi:hypothetical protein
MLFLLLLLCNIFQSRVVLNLQHCRTMLNRSGDSGHPCLGPDFRGNGFSFSLLSMMLAIGLSYIAFKMLKYIAFIPSFLRAFTTKCC